MSYIHLVVGTGCPVHQAWTNNPDTAYEALSPKDTAEYLLEQALFVHLVNTIYNGKPPILLAGYLRSLQGKFRELNRLNSTTAQDIDFKNRAFIAERLVSGTDFNARDAIALLDAQALNPAYPHPFGPEGSAFYKPYLQYYSTQDSTENIDVQSPCALPVFSLRARTLFVGSMKFMGYHMNDALRKDLAKEPFPIAPRNYLAFLSGCNWKESELGSLLGILASYCFDLDRTNAPAGSPENIYATVRAVLTEYKPAISQSVVSLCQSFDDINYRRSLISLLRALRSVYGLKIENSSLVAELLGNEKEKGINDLNAYLSADSAASVSVEQRNAFRKSVFAQYEELSIESRDARRKACVSPSGKVPPTPADIRQLKETLDALYLKDIQITGPAPLTDKKKAADANAESALDIGDDFEKGVSDNPTGDDPGAGGDAGATGADDTPGTGSDGSDVPPATPNGDPGANANPDQATPGNPDTHVPNLPEVSDKTGIRIELSSSETTDTVLYRRELADFINKVIDNPPKGMSIEKIEALKNVRAYWLNLLSVQSAYDIINFLVKLPPMFKLKQSKETH